jgi:hypothetical protein
MLKHISCGGSVALPVVLSEIPYFRFNKLHLLLPEFTRQCSKFVGQSLMSAFHLVLSCLLI